MSEITDGDMLDEPDWAWELADRIVLGNQGVGNASVLIHRAFKAQLATARIEGVRAGIEASAGALEADAKLCDCYARGEGECACGAWSDYKTVPIERAAELVRALDPAAIAEALTRSAALSDLIAGDVHLIDAPATDSDGDEV